MAEHWPGHPAGPCRKAVDECESGSWMALFPVFESPAPRFVGIAVSISLFPDHEGELFHLNCTLRLSSTMTRLVLNRNARARRAQTLLATPLWAGKSSANASASVRGQQGEPARGEAHSRLSPKDCHWAAELLSSCVCIALSRLPHLLECGEWIFKAAVNTRSRSRGGGFRL